jgi:hypothetical protein
MGAKERGKTFTLNIVPGTTLSHVVILSVSADVSAPEVGGDCNLRGLARTFEE